MTFFLRLEFLLIVIMTFALLDNYHSVRHFVNKSVFVIYPSAPINGITQMFGLALTRKRLALYIF